MTKPGLGLCQIGSTAINPVPMKMIIQSVNDVIKSNNQIMKNNGLGVIISVPAGEEIAKKTDNPLIGYTLVEYQSFWNHWHSSSLLVQLLLQHP